MCGIIGYAGYKSGAKEVYEGLKLLEYRGYDSAGISVLNEGGIVTKKKSGRVVELEKYVGHLEGKIAIGHTRWATHGKPSDTNAHPHVVGKFSVVHNGIIENYTQLKAELMGQGTTFLSDTDSEVVAHLLNKYYDGDLLHTVKRVVGLLKGSYALTILCEDFEGVCAVKHSSPAIVGYGRGENYVVSDLCALFNKAQKMTILKQDDIAFITADKVTIYDGEGIEVEREKYEILPEETGVSLGTFPHYMLKEINENAQSLRHTCGAFFKSNLRRLKEQLDGADKIIIVGCGTAYNSGLVAKRWFEECGCTLVDVEVASEVRYFPPKVTKSTLVLAVSQSGETADTVEAASILRGMGAYVVAITNVDYSAITKIADQVVNVVAGCEICVAATKSYIGQLTSLYMLSQLKKGTADCGFAVLNQIAQSVESVVQNDELIDKISSLCAKSSAVFFLGRGIDYAVAVEGSLKLKEVSYIFSDGYPAGELKHGTLALVDEKTLGIIIITHVQLLEKCQSTVEQIVSRHGRVVVITTLQGVLEKLKGKAECVLTLPEADENLSPFLTATAVQLIAYKTAVKLGRNPDRPRNLAKSVTVE